MRLVRGVADRHDHRQLPEWQVDLLAKPLLVRRRLDLDQCLGCVLAGLGRLVYLEMGCCWGSTLVSEAHGLGRSRLPRQMNLHLD